MAWILPAILFTSPDNNVKCCRVTQLPFWYTSFIMLLVKSGQNVTFKTSTIHNPVRYS